MKRQKEYSEEAPEAEAQVHTFHIALFSLFKFEFEYLETFLIDLMHPHSSI